MVISGLPKKLNKPTLICFILIKYMDHINYDKIITYLYDYFKFLHKIIHSDFEKAMAIAIKNNIYIKNDLIHIKCLFHFSQIIKLKLTQIGYIKKKSKFRNFT